LKQTNKQTNKQTLLKQIQEHYFIKQLPNILIFLVVYFVVFLQLELKQLRGFLF
jgi:hypothetical protein